MKLFKSIFACVIVTSVVTAVVGLIFIRTHGKAVLERVLSRSFQKIVTIGTLTYIPPLTLNIDDLKIDNDFHADKTIVELKSGSVASYIKHKISGEPIDLEIQSIWFKGGSLNYPLALAAKTVQIQAKDIELLTENLTIPLKDEKTLFEFKGILLNDGLPVVGDHLQSTGWINYVKRDLDAVANLKDEKGGVSLSAKAQSLDNDMTVNGNVLLKSFPVLASGSSDPKGALSQIITDTIEAMSIEVSADFLFKTKLDDFKVEQLSFSGNINSL